MRAQLAREYAEGLRNLLRSKGAVVNVLEEARERHPASPERWVSAYGEWKEVEATWHLLPPTHPEARGYRDAAAYFHACPLLVPEGVEIEEVTYSEFGGIDSPEVVTQGVNAYGGREGSVSEIRCGCGRLRGLTLRWEGSLQEALLSVLGEPTRVIFKL